MSMSPKRFYEFGPFRLDPETGDLWRRGKPIKLPPKESQVLLALVEAKGALCTIEGILNKVWPDTSVEEQSVTVSISNLRDALGEDSGAHYIGTVRGSRRGYRLVAEVTERQSNDKSQRFRQFVGWATLAALIVVTCSVILIRRYPRSGKVTEGGRFYGLALDYERRGDDDQALAALDRAIALDPGLAGAYLEAACIHHDLGEEDSAAEYLGKAKTVAETRDQAFKLTVEGLELEIDGDQDEALKDYQLLVDRFPQNVEGDYRLADLALEMRRFDDAGRALAACKAAEPDNPYCDIDALVLSLVRNDFDEVIRQSEDLSKRGVRYPWFHAPVGAALLGKNDLHGAALEFHALERVSTKFHGTAHFRAAKERLADLDLYSGRFDSARAQLREAMETAQSTQERAEDLIFQARVEALVGRAGVARSAATEATRISASPLVYISAARVLAAEGDVGALNSVLSGRMPGGGELGDIGPANINFVKGAFALRRGKLDEALVMLASSYEEDDDPFTAFVLAQAHQKAKHWNDGVEWYGRVLAARGDVIWNDIPALVPLAQYQIANCYRELGKINEARSAYSEFLALWSNADPGLEEVRSAKMALAALSRQAPILPD
jgi:DNA-binding winged helix-turn-helix (wHTH) protein/tetratricopeptide (TPR) repeat protein